MQQFNSTANGTHTTLANQLSSGFLGLCFLVGVPGNIGVMVVILRHFKKDNFTLHLMLSLATSDILCLIFLPLWIYALLDSWVFGQITCKALSYVIVTSLYASLLIVTLMSIHRFVVVLYPLRWARLGKKGQLALLVSLWVLACVKCSSAGVTFDITADEEKKGCIRHREVEHKVVILTFEILLGFVIPVSLLVTSYCCLHKKVNQTAFFRNRRLTKLITSIIVTFFALWTPIHVLNLLEIIASSLERSFPSASKQLSKFSDKSASIIISLIFVNSCVNPFLYAFAFRGLGRNQQLDGGNA